MSLCPLGKINVLLKDRLFFAAKFAPTKQRNKETRLSYSLRQRHSLGKLHGWIANPPSNHKSMSVSIFFSYLICLTCIYEYQFCNLFFHFVLYPCAAREKYNMYRSKVFAAVKVK